MSRERWARLIAGATVTLVPLAALAPRWIDVTDRDVVEIRATMPAEGGWSPAEIVTTAGTPLHLRLRSDDVVHSFAVGWNGGPAIELKPGVAVDTTLVFDRPGRYVFYCARWCEPDHWRMRGTIVVRPTAEPAPVEALPPRPLFERLGLDLDAPHPSADPPRRRPSARRGAALGTEPPLSYHSEDSYLEHSPAETWRQLRAEQFTRALSDDDVWDLVALLAAERATPAVRGAGRRLYRTNCSACHGEAGDGHGVFADRIPADTTARPGHRPRGPADFTDASAMLGAAPALLQGKIARGGMGTGMPNWGPILTDSEMWALVAYLWTFSLDGLDLRDTVGAATSEQRRAQP